MRITPCFTLSAELDSVLQALYGLYCAHCARQPTTPLSVADWLSGELLARLAEYFSPGKGKRHALEISFSTVPGPASGITYTCSVDVSDSLATVLESYYLAYLEDCAAQEAAPLEDEAWFSNAAAVLFIHFLTAACTRPAPVSAGVVALPPVAALWPGFAAVAPSRSAALRRQRPRRGSR